MPRLIKMVEDRLAEVAFSKKTESKWFKEWMDGIKLPPKKWVDKPKKPTK